MRRSWKAGGSPTVLLAVLVSALSAFAGPVQAQAPAGGDGAYLRSVAAHFDLSEGEAGLLVERLRAPGELPVVLFVATRSGISPEAVVALRRTGWEWQRIFHRYGIRAHDLYVPLASPPEEGALGGAYRRYREVPPSAWPALELPDPAVVSLVNLVFLVDYLDLPPARVASVLALRGSPAAAYRELLGGRLP